MALNDKTSSFGLVRTNPKISGNVKITVDSAGEVWLNTINANRELSSSDYKKFRTTQTSTYESDLKKFIGSLPPEIVFEVKPGADPTAVSDSFQNQFDLFYSMGVQPLISDAYDEDYSYFAPLWLRDQLPEYFVIFRIDEPLDFPYNENVESGDLVQGKEYKVSGAGYKVAYENLLYEDGDTFVATGTNTYSVFAGSGKVVDLDENKDLPIDYAALFDKLVKNAQVVETFDLGPESKIGKYIRRIKDNPNFPRSPITMRFEDGLLSTWNGISYQSGITVSKGEFLSDYWKNSQTQIDFEEFITNGFQRQGIICPFLLNLEFLFDDETAPMYNIPRYFGFYVNRTQIGEFQLSGSKLFENRQNSGNTPLPKRDNKGYRYMDEDFFQNNEEGVRLYYENSSGIIPSSDFFTPTNFQQRMYWIQDKDGKFYSLNQKPEVFPNGQYNIGETDIVLRNKSVNLGRLAGKHNIKIQGKGAILDSKGRSYMAIKVNDQLLPNDRIRIYWNIGTQVDVQGRFDEITAADLRRYFTIPAAGTTVSIYGNVAALYSIGQEIEITYDPDNVTERTITSVPTFGGTYTTFTIDSPINANATSGYISIVKGWGKGSALAAQNYNPIYFHPYGTPEQVARAIANAFNKLEQRNYDAVPVGDTCVIRLRNGQSSTNQFFAKFYLTLPERVTAQGSSVDLNPTGEYYFEGGTDRANTRLRCQIQDMEKLMSGDVYLRTKLGISRIAHVGRYVDDAVQEQGGSEIADLAGFNDYAVITIENPSDEPVIGSIKEYIAYELYKVPVGLFSFYNIKDIDGDFWSSTYNRSPVNELKRYFNLPANEDVLVPGRQYYVLGDNATDSIVHDTVTYTVGTSFTATTTSYESDTGSPFVVAFIFYRKAFVEADSLSPGSYEVLGDPTLDSVEVYDNFGTIPLSPFYAGSTFTLATAGRFVKNTGNATVIQVIAPVDRHKELDPDLASFPGFTKFKDFLTIDEENANKDTIAFKLNDKFFFGDIDNEYDYLKENFNKDLVTKSRLSQVVSKWVYQGGLDVRDNPYRLNTHPVFGSFNFSPSLDIKTQSPEGFTHEWYYLEGTPGQYPESLKADNYYFFENKLDINALINANPSADDYFADYFTVEPVPNSPLQERYTIFDYNTETGLSETFFRGAKIRIKEIVRDTQARELRGVKPPFKDRSTKFDGYRFTSILRVMKERRGVLESPVAIQLFENKTFKTITMVIDVLLDDYRALTLEDPSYLGSAASPFVSYPDTLDTNIDYMSLYSMKSKREEATFFDNVNFITQGLDAYRIGDVKLSVALDFSTPSGAIGPYTYVNVFNNPDYDWDLRDEVKSFAPSNYFKGEFQFGDTKHPSALLVTQSQVLFGVPFVTTGYPAYPSVGLPDPATFTAPANPANPIAIPYGSSFEWQGFATYVNAGGSLYYEPIMQRISFGRIAERVNNYSPYIKYRSFEWSNNTTVEVDPGFFIEFEQPSTIMKMTALIPGTDDDKPEEYKNEPVIGTVLSEVNAAYIMYRFSGPYEPKFKNVFHFKSQVTDAIPQPGDSQFDLSFLQATFNPNVDGFGKIKNFGYLKVSNTDILALVNNTKYKSLYPLVQETAIDKMDFPVYLSSWDPGFWRKFINKSTYKFQAGTREMLEVKNFLATKVMKTPRNVSLETFQVEQVQNIEEINPATFSGEIVYSVTPGVDVTVASKVQGYINVQQRLIRYLIEDGADGEFVKYLMPEFGIGDPDVISDDVIAYLNLNVVPTYEIKEFVTYVRYYKEDSLSLDVVVGNLTDSQKFDDGYRVERNFTANKIGDFLYRFEFLMEPSRNASLAMTMNVGKI